MFTPLSYLLYVGINTRDMVLTPSHIYFFERSLLIFIVWIHQAMMNLDDILLTYIIRPLRGEKPEAIARH